MGAPGLLTAVVAIAYGTGHGLIRYLKTHFAAVALPTEHKISLTFRLRSQLAERTSYVAFGSEAAKKPMAAILSASLQSFRSAIGQV